MSLAPSLDTAALVRLISLRYRLHWAKVRSRQGRIALAMVAALIIGVIAVLAGLGGLGAAVAAVREGRATQLALAVLLTCYLLAIAVSMPSWCCLCSYAATHRRLA